MTLPLRSLPMVPRGERGGGLKLADDDRGHPCYCCGRGPKDGVRVRFLLVAQGSVTDDPPKLFLRVCSGCLDVITVLHQRIRDPRPVQAARHRRPGEGRSREGDPVLLEMLAGLPADGGR